MNIHKILNNNVIVILDEEGNERIVMGRGIGFSKKPGDIINPKGIEKIFAQKNYIEVDYSEKADDKYLFITEAIIQKAKICLKEPLNQKLYLSLGEYLVHFIEQARKGINKTNILKSDIEKYYPDEYAVGLYGIDLIEKKLNVKLKEDVAGFIALHLFTGRLGNCTCKTGEVPEMIQEISDIVNNFFDIRICKEDLSSSGFRRYLNYLSSKALTLNERASEENDNGIVDSLILKEKAEPYQCALKISMCQ